MTPLYVRDKVMLRLPRFSYNALLVDKWGELKALIKDASPDFYSLVKDMTWIAFCSADEKIQTTARKYFNRACYRATPFAGFASVSLAQTGVGGQALQTHRDPVIYSYEDWTGAKLPDTLVNLDDPHLLLFTNATYYRLQEDIRFLQRFEESFQIAAIEYDPLIILVLEACAQPTCFEALCRHVRKNITEDQLRKLATELLEAQLLLTSLHPNIIGTDYFKRVDIPRTLAEKKYLIAGRKINTGCFDRQQFQHLPELVIQLNRLLPVTEQPELKQFKQDFLRRFDQAEVPLMLALDPEAGVGYGGREQYYGNDFLDGLETAAGQSADEAYLKLREGIYQKLLNAGVVQEITLDALIPTPANVPDSKLPNSLAVACTLSADLLYLDYLGGTSANSIFGRFALALPDVADHCKQVAVAEAAANPDVVLFDVGYTKEGYVDNINRRPELYECQLNLLNYDTSQSPLLLTDIYISVQRDEVVLRSQSLNKRLLPRMATAYNYQRADLSVFRLLMDIQSQGLRTQLSLHLPGMLPGLDRYPRVVFKNIVVSPAAWRLSTKTLEGASIEEPAALSAHLRGLGVGKYAKTGTGDQTLCLSLDSDDDMHLLGRLLAKEKTLLVEEAAEPLECAVVDEDGHSYHAQVIVTLEHDNAVAKPLTSVQQQYPATAAEVWVPPGRDWLYFELYCSPFRTDELLLTIAPMLQEYSSQIQKWFFIRYDEGGNHVRLRLQLKDSSRGYHFTGLVANNLEEALQAGIVTDIKLCTYKKEVHRYLATNIDDVEENFYADSAYVLSIIEDGLSEFERYHLCTSLFSTIEEFGLLGHQAAKHLVDKMVEAYNAEHHIQTLQFKEINRRYKEYKRQAPAALSIQTDALRHRFQASFLQTLSEYAPMIRPKIAADLFHMHVNRLFTNNMRMHEMLIYNLIQLSRREKSFRIFQA